MVFSQPCQDSYVLYDGAMSQFSYGALQKAIIADKKLAVPGGFDEAGNLSNDPKKITKTGTVLPMGFWKGSSLSILMDMMVSSISGGHCVSDIKNQGNTPETETNLSQIFLLLR